jgi:alpha/beta hydrolase family protein DUF900
MVNVPTALPMRQLSFPFRRGGHGKSLRFSGPATLPGNPGRDFVTISADYMDKQAFIAAVNDVAKRTPDAVKVLVFVHGFNNPFDDAVYRFAQIAHDSKAPAIPVLFAGHPLANCAYAPIHTTERAHTSLATPLRNCSTRLLGSRGRPRLTFWRIQWGIGSRSRRCEDGHKRQSICI